jgi:hypothetical protein
MSKQSEKQKEIERIREKIENLSNFIPSDASRSEEALAYRIQELLLLLFDLIIKEFK